HLSRRRDKYPLPGTGPVARNHPTNQTALFEKHIPPTSDWPESQPKDPVTCHIPPLSSNLLNVFEARHGSERTSLVFLDLLNESGQFPARSCLFRAPHVHNGREPIRVREIHQMNCFDDDVCLPRMSAHFCSHP